MNRIGKSKKSRTVTSSLGTGDPLGGGKAALASRLAMFGVPNADTTAGANAGAAFVFDLPDVNNNQVPDACEDNLSYDADGNLVQDENFTYTWDAENRLVKVEPRVVAEGSLRVTNTYDFLGRRIERMTEIYKVAVGNWTQATDTRYLYDGWNVIVEFDGETGNMSKQYTWGLDLSGSLQGAGGVGGLLACNDVRGTATTSDDAAYIYCYDANGNVRELLDSKDGTLVGLYDYDPYGNLLSSGGDEAANNRYRFSTKPWDDVAGLCYYGYRYYSPTLGRWMSRDPIRELGGTNLYGFCGMNPASNIDILGTKWGWNGDPGQNNEGKLIDDDPGFYVWQAELVKLGWHVEFHPVADGAKTAKLSVWLLARYSLTSLYSFGAGQTYYKSKATGAYTFTCDPDTGEIAFDGSVTVAPKQQHETWVKFDISATIKGHRLDVAASWDLGVTASVTTTAGVSVTVGGGATVGEKGVASLSGEGSISISYGSTLTYTGGTAAGGNAVKTYFCRRKDSKQKKS